MNTRIRILVQLKFSISCQLLQNQTVKGTEYESSVPQLIQTIQMFNTKKMSIFLFQYIRCDLIQVSDYYTNSRADFITSYRRNFPSKLSQSFEFDDEVQTTKLKTLISHDESTFESRNLRSNPKYSVMFRIQKAQDLSTVTITAFISKGSQILRFQHEMLRLMMKCFNNANCRKRLGWFAVNPFNGQLIYRCYIVYSACFYSERTLAQETSATIDFMLNVLDTGLSQILWLANLEGLEPPPGQKLINLTRKIDLIKKAVQLSPGTYPNNFPNNPNPERNNTLIQANHPQFQPIVKEIASDLNESEKYFKKLQRSSAQANDRMSVYSDILVVEPDKIDWTILGTTHFSKLEKGKVTFFNRNDQYKKQFSQIMVRKTDLKDYKKVSHQKKILEFLKNYSCHNFIRFFSDESPSLYSEFSPGGQLQKYLSQYKVIFGVETKLYLLCQILQGLRLLRQKSIVHVDLKPQNLLLFRGLVLKLTDLGQSYHSSIEKYKPGYTLPYSSPDIFQLLRKKACFDSKVDIYNFGIIMIESLFGTDPFTIRRCSQDKLIQALGNKTYFQLINLYPIEDSTFGPPELMQTLYILGLKCLHPVRAERPTIDWLIFILRESYYYLNNMY